MQLSSQPIEDDSVITLNIITDADFLFMDNRKHLLSAGIREDIAERFAAHATFIGESVDSLSPQPIYTQAYNDQEEVQA